MREISACGRTPGGVGTARSKPVDPHAHHEPGAERLDVDVGCAQLHRALEQIVDGAHHRCAARKVAQALDVVVAALGRGLVGVDRRLVVLAEPLRQHGREILERGDLDVDRAAEHDLGGARGRDVVRIGEHQPGASVRVLIGKHQGLAQETAGELRRQRRRRDQLRQSHTRQAIERGDFGGKVVGREIARLPKVSQRLVAVSSWG